MAARLDTLSDALQFLKLNRIENFVARTSADKDNTIIFKSNPEDSPAENYDNFQRIAEMTVGAFYIVEQGQRGTHRIEVKNERSAAIQGQTPIVQGIGEVEVNKRIGEALAHYKTEVRLAELEKQNKEYEKELNRRQSVGEQFMERLTPYLGQILPVIAAKFLPQAGTVALAGIEQQNEQNFNNMNTEEIILTDEQTDRAEAALQKWASADPEFLEYIEAFADFAASGKSVKAGFMNVSYAQVKDMFGPAKLREMLQ